MTAPLDAALEYRARGWSVVPAHTATVRGCSCLNDSCDAVGKHPRIKWKPYQDRLPTDEEIRTWWRRWPDANVAILTGAISGIVVVDIDPRHGGDESIRDIPNLTDTLTAKTGGGGEHLYWQHPGHPVPNAAGVRPGIDVRGDGGYVLAPPSGHRSGGFYAWDHGQPDMPAPLPASIADMLRTRPIGDVAPSSRTFDLEAILTRGIPEGERDVTMTRVAGHYAAQGIAYDVLLMTLRGVNATYARPPLDDAALVRIADSIWQREQDKVRVISAVAERLNGHNGDASDVVVPEDRRAMARQVWGELNYPGVVDWVMLRGEVNEYVVFTAEDECRLGPHILDQRAIAHALADGPSVILKPIPAKEWPKWAKILRDLVREEWTEAPKSQDRIDDWLESFTQAKPPDTPEPEGRAKSLRNRAIIVDGQLYIRPVTLMRHMEAEGEVIKLDQLRRLLRRAGWETRVIRAGEQTIRAWTRGGS